MITGILFAQGSAAFQAVQNILNKRLVKKEDPFVVIWYTIFLSMLFLVPTVLMSGIPQLSSQFFVFLGIRLLLDVFALSLYFFALKHGDVSLVIPLSTFSVVFSLISSSAINKELPNWLGFLGILVVIMGTYTLNLTKTELKRDLLLPLKLLLKKSEARMVLMSAFLYGIIYSVNKAGIRESSTSFFTFSAAFGLLIIFTFVVLFKTKGRFFSAVQLKKLPHFFPLGIIDGIKIFLFMLAVTNTLVPFADASDNTTAVYSTLLAGYLFKEEIKPRLIPICIMIFGVVLITLSTAF